jgi:hypothetical protein
LTANDGPSKPFVQLTVYRKFSTQINRNRRQETSGDSFHRDASTEVDLWYHAKVAILIGHNSGYPSCQKKGCGGTK